MDSPSAQLIADFNGPPSSPFVHEVDARMASPVRPWRTQQVAHTQNDIAPTSPSKYSWRREEDKENMTQDDATLAKLFRSPRKHSPATPDASPNKLGASSGNDWDLMPPPSTRKISATPRRSPLKSSSRSGAQTPNAFGRGELSGRRTPSSRAAAVSTPTDETANLDDTCFSAFSEIPDMTTFAKLRHSPTKQTEVFHTPRADLGPTPRTSRKRASPSRSPSPTPRSRRVKMPSGTASQDGTTSFLIDFTQQMEGLSSYKLNSPAKSATESNLLQFINTQRTSPNKASRQGHATPGKQSNILDLLDFELPPAPTPRSVPTITVRELESLKSSYLSQISSLKATLSGREAEVESLKKAIGDAERRAGEAQEASREEKCRREQAEEEKQGWERRGQELEQVLRNVKEEVIKGEAEKEDMLHRIEDAEKRSSEAESRALKAEERFAEAIAARVSGDEADGDAAATEEKIQALVAAQIDSKIEAVSRELHAVYKEKHERKVSTLKKSYEARSEKKMADLQSRISSLEKENHDLQSSRDANFSGPVAETSMLNTETVELKAQLEEQKAALARLESEMEASKSHQAQLERDLKQERIEKGDLVAAVDEMLALQSEQPPTPGSNPMKGALDMVQDFRKSISRPSGLRVPGGSAGESRIGRGGGSASSSLRGGAAMNAAGGKSKMLANIERMGRSVSKDGSTGL